MTRRLTLKSLSLLLLWLSFVNTQGLKIFDKQETLLLDSVKEHAIRTSKPTSFYRRVLQNVRGGDEMSKNHADVRLIESMTDHAPTTNLDGPITDLPSSTRTNLELSTLSLSVVQKLRSIRGGEEDEDYDLEEEYDEEDDEDYDDDDDEEEENLLDTVVDTVSVVSKKSSVLAVKYSKIGAIWIKQWSRDIFRACKRAIEAGKLELEEGTDDDSLIAELSEDEEDPPVLIVYGKKVWRLSKRVYRTMESMTFAFWKFDDEDIIVDMEEEVEEEQNAFKSTISFFTNLKRTKNTEEDTPQVVDITEKEVSNEKAMKCVGGDIVPSLTKTKNIKSLTLEAPLDDVADEQTSTSVVEPAVVTIIPKTRKRDVFFNVVLGAASILMWEQGGKAFFEQGVTKVKEEISKRK